jgi:hypothetical protein
MDPQSKESQLRHAARVLGLRLEKSPSSQDPHDLTFGGYMLVFMERNAVAYGAAGHTGSGYTLTLNGVEAYLKRRQKQQKKRVEDSVIGPYSGCPKKGTNQLSAKGKQWLR